MELGKSYKVFKLATSEIIITEILEVSEEDGGKYFLGYPAVIIPMQQQGQIGFGKMMPFSDYSKDVVLFHKAILVDTEPDPKMVDAYESWLKQVKAAESGIIVPNMQAPPSNVTKPDFRGKLNT